MTEFTTYFLNRFPSVLSWLSVSRGEALFDDAPCFFIDGRRCAGACGDVGATHDLMIRPQINGSNRGRAFIAAQHAIAMSMQGRTYGKKAGSSAWHLSSSMWQALSRLGGTNPTAFGDHVQHRARPAQP